MSLYETAVKRPVTTVMVFFAVLVLGLFSFINLPVDLFPELNPPVITVFTSYPGANAQEVERNVTEVIEDALSTVNNLDDISSTSIDNVSTITLEFDWETNLDEAANDIRQSLGLVQAQLPEDAEEPTIFRFSSSAVPVMMFSATAEESYPALRKLLEDELVDPLNRVPGVGGVGISGGPERVIRVELDPQRLAAYSLSVQELANTIRLENLNVPGGDLEIGPMEYGVSVSGEFKDPQELNNLVVSSRNGQVVYLGDVATVNDTLKEVTQVERINQNRGVQITVQKQSDANTIEVVEQIKEKLPSIIAQLPDDVQIIEVFDSSEFIQNSINSLSEVLFYAVLFVIVVVLAFLKKWRATFVIILTIPFSLVVAFIYLFLTDQTLNLISLSSLSIAMGMVVDDAIVVLENITKHLEKGSRPREAAIYGTNEVGLAVFATTLTVVAVFFPLTFLSGMMGIWFGQLGMIVTVTIITSTIAAITLIPMLSSKMLKTVKKDDKPKSGIGQKISNGLERVLQGIDNFYQKTLTWAVYHRTTVVITSLVIFFGSFLLVPMLETEFMPKSDNARMQMTVELGVGRSLEQTAGVNARIERLLLEYPEIQIVSSSFGTSDEGSVFTSSQAAGSNIINYNVSLSRKSERERSIFEVADLLRAQLQEFPAVIEYSIQTGNSGMGGGGQQKPVSISVIGNDFSETSVVAEELAEALRAIEGTRDVEISRGDERPELRVEFDREKLARLGLSTSAVSTAIRSRIAGVTATQYREAGDEFDVILRYEEEARKSVSALENILVTSPVTGETVRVGDLGEVVEFFAPPNIERENRERVVKVTSDLYGAGLGEVTEAVQAKIATMDVPAGVDVEFGGDIEEQQESLGDLGLLLVLSIILVYIVMAAQFESFREPFIIMLSIPFAFTGVVLTMALTGTTMSVIAILGGVILVGIVVKNAIVLVDYANLMRDRGVPIMKAVIESGVSRLRPVLMTTLTTILAMVPLAISTGEGAEIWRPMAIAVIGGLTFSTAVTLLFVPVIYTTFEKRKQKRRHNKERKANPALQTADANL